MTQRVRVRATALRVLDDKFPIRWEVAVIDAVGREHRIEEKAPVLTTLHDDPGAWPFLLLLDATAASQDGPSMRVTLLHGAETTEGRSVLDMALEDVVW